MTDALGNKLVETYDFPFKNDLLMLKNTVDKPYLISFECLEISTFCPLTNAPDYGKLWIEFVPDGLVVETKTLKQYLVKFRDQDMFQEEVVNQVCKDLFDAMKPHIIRVRGEFNIRGGIRERAIALRKKEDVSDEIKEIMCSDSLGWIG